MCRLFGMSASPHRVHATFWLLEAPDSLSEQSRREPDGTGLGTFDDEGRPIVSKQPLAAYEDQEFARDAKADLSQTFVAHVRFASTGAIEERNTHPFEQKGRLFAHNGVIKDLERIDRELGDDLSLVQGDTDSERFFALVTRETEARDGDVGAGLTAALSWAAENVPIYALNVILATPHELWAVRYPDTHDLFVLERQAGGRHGGRHFHGSSPHGRVHVRSSHLADRDAVVVATERMDENPDWRPLESGELLHVGADGRASSQIVIEDEPVHRLTLADLHPQEAASQAATPAA